MELWRLLGDLHPKLVQFPLVLLLMGLLFDLGGLLGRSARAHWAALVTTATGTVGLLFAFICGIYAEIWAGRAGVPHHPIELHELVANLASWGFVLLLAWRIFLKMEKRGAVKAYVAVGLAWYGLLVLTGWLGGQLVFEYGAGAPGVRANAVLTMEELNTLATRQTDMNLRYSEWMHHIFGWMTLGLSASLLAQAVWPRQAPRLKWIIPTFLLVGGVFLFFYADRDLYALNDWRQWRDREVQLHKTLAVVMGTIGVVGLLRGRKQRTQNAERGSVGEYPHAERGGNSRLVAVLALIGGAMLFTHVHTVAPYANVAAGVYIAHVVMGLVALGIGVTRLMQDWAPGWKRPLAVGFALLMGAESILLITYNEGLPWFIGYGRYNRWALDLEDDKAQMVLHEQDASWTVAPFGDFRAVLFINQPEGKAFVSFRDRFTQNSQAVTFDRPPVLLLSRGYQETAYPLVNSDAGAPALSGNNFRTEAEFLRHSPAFGARLEVSIHGRRQVGFFDPWVTPLVRPVPPNELATHECPMHLGVRTTRKGECPLCGMALQPIRGARRAGELHDAGYALRVAEMASKGPLGARVLLEPMKDGARLTPLAIVHEQPMHLIVVSEDLAFFDHVHPVAATGDERLNGVFAWTYRFPRPGKYLLFADYTPKGDRGQVFRIPLEVMESGIHVSEASFKPAALVLDPAGGKLVASVPAGKTAQDSAPLDKTAPASSPEDVHVELVSQPRTLAAGTHSHLIFRLTDARGKPITDLKPYLGAMGHCVILSEDGMLYLHSHPEQLGNPAPDERGGPDVAFHTLFQKAGKYQVWAQFKRPGEKAGDPDRLVIADFVVEVKEPILPASVLQFFFFNG